MYAQAALSCDGERCLPGGPRPMSMARDLRPRERRAGQNAEDRKRNLQVALGQGPDYLQALDTVPAGSNAPNTYRR